MSINISDLIDLTKIDLNLNLEFDTLDVVLLVTTGGVGYLARAAYNHFNGKAARDLKLQTKNLEKLIEECQQKNAKRLFIRVHPNVPVFAPGGAEVLVLSQSSDAKDVEIIFSNS